MIRYADDLYPRTDPRDGARIRRLASLQEAYFERVRNGTGAGKIALRATTASAQDIDPLGLQYVRKVRINTDVVDVATLSGFDELVVGGYWFEEGDFLALDQRRRRLLSFGGAGTLAYLDREIMWSHSYLDEVGLAGTMDPFDDIWRLWNQGDWAGGDFLGAVLWRVISEGLAHRIGATYTHRHATPDEFGVEFTDAHDDDKLETAIPFVTLGFDQFQDSSGNDWTVPSGEFEAMVGESLYDVTQRLMEAGLYVEMDPDTFELRAWEVANHGRDRTGLAWGANVVRFEPPPPPSTARTAGNILNDLKRALHPLIRATGLLAGGQDTYALATQAGDVPWHRHYPARVDDVAALGPIAARQLGARNDAGDQVLVRSKVGNDPANGYYLPEEHAKVDDLVAVHSGTGTWDWDEAAYPVAKWSVNTRRTGAPDVFYHLGASYHAGASKEFAGGAGVGRHTHPPNPRLCPNDAGPIRMDTTWKALNVKGTTAPDGWMMPGFDDSGWANAEVYAAAGNYVIPMGTDETSNAIPSDEVVLRKEFYIEPETLVGADVALRYALDNAGSIYVNGVAIATLGPDFTNTATHWNSDHATTLARSAFRAGYNCVAIYVNNDSSGSSGATPPGAMAAGVEIDIDTTNGNGTSKYAARCDIHLHASDIDENNHGNVQAAVDDHEDRLDALESGASSDSAVDALRRHMHGVFVASYHRASDELPILMASLDGVTWDDLGPMLGATTVRDPSIIHWDGAYWMIATKGAATSFKLYSKADLFDASVAWSEVATVTADASGTNVWAPEWIRNVDGTPYLHPSTGLPCATVNVSTDSQTTFTVRELHPTNRAMTSWSASTTITGTSLPSSMIDGFLMVDVDTFYLWFKDEANKHIEIAESSALTSGYTLLEQGDWAGWFAGKSGSANSIEGPCVIRLDDGRWRIYFNENNGFSSIRAVYSETTDDWRTGTSTWTAQAVITTDALMSHGSVVYLPGIYDHQRDPDAHPSKADVDHDHVHDHDADYEPLGAIATHDADADAHASLAAAIAASGLLTVDPGTVTYDHSGDDVLVNVAAVWGYDSDGPYYDDAGATSGEEAILVLDPSTGELTLVPYNP